ncbi:MAG: ABC transporter ATP-binding protein [Chloroflexi bacterium]|nr:ABC transporter ATP-binding protein [Chloroflexota bacterium]
MVSDNSPGNSPDAAASAPPDAAPTDVMPEDVMIDVRDLTHYYGPNPAVENVNFTVRRGEILGFLGPNGAGKTTTMRILTGFMPPTRGSVSLDGYDVVEKSLEVRKRVGYLPESVPLHTEMTVTGYLKYMGTLRRMNGRRIRSRVDDVIDVCRLGDYHKTLIGKLSKGFRQRVGIAQAILHEPEVLVLDEPTIGIDPIQVVETRGLIQDLGREQTVVLSSHILPEVSMICERVLIIHEGHIVAADTPNNLAQHLQGVEQLEVEIGGPPAEVLSVLRAIDGATGVTHHPRPGINAYRVQFREGLDLRDEISRTVISHDWSLLSMQVNSMSLEEIFLRLTTSETDDEDFA